MEQINLHDEFNKDRGSLSYRFLLQAVSEIDYDFSSADNLQVELKINGHNIPIMEMLRGYEKAYDACVLEEAEKLLDEKIDRLKRIILNSKFTEE